MTTMETIDIYYNYKSVDPILSNIFFAAFISFLIPDFLNFQSQAGQTNIKEINTAKYRTRKK